MTEGLPVLDVDLFGDASLRDPFDRDERHYADPDRFDMTRDARDHLAWGTGPDMCAGLHLARIEMEVMLDALIEANVAPSAGKPEMGSSRGLYGFTRLPLRLD